MAGTEWDCGRCQQHNPAWRDFCAKCSAQRWAVPFGAPAGPVPPPPKPTGTGERVGRQVLAIVGGLAVAALAVVGLTTLLGGDDDPPVESSPATPDEEVRADPLFDGGSGISMPRQLERLLPRDLGAGWTEFVRTNSDDAHADLGITETEVTEAGDTCGAPDFGEPTDSPRGVAIYYGQNTDSVAILAVSLEADVAGAQAALDGLTNGPLLECLRSTIEAQLRDVLAPLGVGIDVVAELRGLPTTVEAGVDMRVTATASAGPYRIPLYLDIYVMRQGKAFVYYQFVTRGVPLPDRVVDRLTQELVTNLGDRTG